jgi:hypothetical protein
MDFTNINFVAIALGTIGALLFGFVWYAPPVFGKVWQRHTKITDAQMKEKVLLRFGPAIALTFITGVMLDVLLPADMLRWDDGAVMGLLVGLGIVAPAIAIHYIFARKSVHLYLIDAGYSVFSMLILGGILAAMS